MYVLRNIEMSSRIIVAVEYHTRVGTRTRGLLHAHACM